MEKGTLSEINEGIQRHMKNKSGRSLKVLQISADEKRLVRSSMVLPNDKVSLKEKPEAMEKVIIAEKENVLTMRRSKRKTTTEKVTYTESPLESKTTKPKSTIKNKKNASKPKKGRCTATKKNDQKPTSNQTKLNFSSVVIDTVKEDLDVPQLGMTEDSGFDPACCISDQSPMNSTAVMKSPAIMPHSEISIITGDSPSLNYWRDLSEQRRIALEKALHENELLHDQLAVLEAENSQLKQLLREAENLAQVVRAIVD